jgi:hypothetical protein
MPQPDDLSLVIRDKDTVTDHRKPLQSRCDRLEGGRIAQLVEQACNVLSIDRAGVTDRQSHGSRL